MDTPTAPAGDSDADATARKAAEGAGAHLVCRDELGRQHIFELGDKRPLTLGRRLEADLSLPWDQEVSRLHAEIECKAGEWTLTDDGLSQNGTFVNELRVDGRRRLEDGDLVRVGRTALTFRRPGPTDRAVTLAPSELAGTPSFADQQQRILRALCRPLFGDGEGLEAATDATVAEETGIHVETVARELDHLGRTFGLQAMPQAERRSEIALLAVRSGLVSADDQQ